MNYMRFICVILFMVFLFACAGTEKPAPAKPTEFLTLGDISGRTKLVEEGPDQRVINVKAKAFIKQNDLRLARDQAMGMGAQLAIDMMVQELLTPDIYNKNYSQIDKYFSQNIDKYILESEVINERRIYLEKFYGVFGSFKVSRQAVLVALQKDLKIVDTSMSTLVVVITSKKDLDLSEFNIRFSDIEESMLNQIQTSLNQRGLRAMDYRNAITSFAENAQQNAEFRNMNKEQFMSMVYGAKPEDTALAAKAANADQFYSSGLSLLRQLSRVVVEVNVMSISKTNDTMAMNLMVTAKNISSPTGGAFANSNLQVARRGSVQTDNAGMLGALVKDAFAQMEAQFIPQVVKEMSTIDATGNKLLAFDLVFQGFEPGLSRTIRTSLKRKDSEEFKYIDYDNQLSQLVPPVSVVFVRWSGTPSALADQVMEVLDTENVKFQEPIVAPNLRDLVFIKAVE